MKLVIASNNAHKVREIKEILSGCFEEILSLKEAGIVIDVVEDGKTFEENALKKAEEVLKVCSADAALRVDALDGAPGVYSARFAAEGHDDEANNKKLIALMQNVADSERTCRFVSAVALARRDKAPLICRGTVEGRLLREKRGENGFGYDPLFFYEPAGLSFAQMSAESKNAVSHRRRALEALRNELEAEAEKKQ